MNPTFLRGFPRLQAKAPFNIARARLPRIRPQHKLLTINNGMYLLTIDTCHKLVEHHCATCDDVIGYDIETNHGTNVEDIDVAVDSCTTITYTICHDCEMIADKETNSDHQHVTQVCCIGHEVEDYDIDIYVFENAIYMFDYCTDCGKVVGGVSQIRPYDTIEHAFVPTGVEVFTLSEYGGYYSYNYVQKKYDHIYDESGHCIFCNAMHYDMGDEPIEFYVRYYYGYPECYFVIKDTKQILYLNDFDNNPENVYLEEGYKEIYESSDYPGIQLIKYYDNNYENVKIEILYNNLGTSQIILPSNFDN